jgi:23S rRNA pseudouridine1911/1915/1917 synthase
MAETLTLKTDDETPRQRLDRWLAENSGIEALSRSRIKNLILDGQLSCNGQPETDPSSVVRGSAVYQLTLPEAAAALPEAEDIALDILYEDEAMIVINKPAGMVVHPAPGALTGTLVNALLAHCGDSLTGIGGVARPGIVHRLDKDTSGVMVAAKTDIAHSRLSEMFAAHDLDRRYNALVWGMPAARHGTIDAPLGRHRTDRKRQAVMERGRHAITHYKTLRDLPPFGCLLECRLETGRTHQIRVHMAHLGHGVMGDPLYGRPKRAGQMPDSHSRTALARLRAFPRQALHAKTLSFAHPLSGAEMDFSAEMPADMAGLIALIDNAITERGLPQ